MCLIPKEYEMEYKLSCFIFNITHTRKYDIKKKNSEEGYEKFSFKSVI